MMAARFDPRRGVMLGTPITVMDGIGYYDLSDDGKLFYATQPGVSGSMRQLIWVDRTGAATPVDSTWTFSRGLDGNTRHSLSPDGSMVTLREFGAEGYDIWVKRVDRGPRSRLTFGPEEERMPVWSPGGRAVTYLSPVNGNYDVWQRSADGTGEPTLLLDLEDDIATVDWSPDGEWLLVRTSEGTTQAAARNVPAFRPGRDSVPTPLFSGEYREVGPAVSPDGRWIAYASDETGRYEVYVRPFPDVNAGRWQISIDGGRNPQWAHSGRELFFQGDGRRMMVVPITPGATFGAGTPSMLFQGDVAWEGTGGVHPDDQRFLMSTSVIAGADSIEAALPSVVLVNNFAEELRRLVP
jgi:hypothetical protein